MNLIASIKTVFTLIVISFCLIGTPVYAETVNFKKMTLEELQTYDTEGLDEKQLKKHSKALKKATKKAEREARRAARKNEPYCSRSAKARGVCS